MPCKPDAYGKRAAERRFSPDVIKNVVRQAVASTASSGRTPPPWSGYRRHPPPRAIAHDALYAFRRTWDREPEGRCRVRLLQQDGAPPVMVLTEMNSTPSTSVTNMVEVLAAELIVRHPPDRFAVVGEDPAIVAEYDEPLVDERTGRLGRSTYGRVILADWRPRRVWLGEQERLSLGEPDWRHLPHAAVKALPGDEADDLPQQVRHRQPAPDGHLEAEYDDDQQTTTGV